MQKLADRVTRSVPYFWIAIVIIPALRKTIFSFWVKTMNEIGQLVFGAIVAVVIMVFFGKTYPISALIGTANPILAGLGVYFVITFLTNLVIIPAKEYFNVKPSRANFKVTIHGDFSSNKPNIITGISVEIENIGDPVTNVDVWRTKLISNQDKRLVSIDSNISPTNAIFTDWVNPSEKHMIGKGGRVFVRMVANKDNSLLLLLSEPYHVVDTTLFSYRSNDGRIKQCDYVVCDIESRVTGQKMNGDSIAPVSFRFSFLFKRYISGWTVQRFGWGEIKEAVYAYSEIWMGDDVKKQLEMIRAQSSDSHRIEKNEQKETENQ